MGRACASQHSFAVSLRDVSVSPSLREHLFLALKCRALPPPPSRTDVATCANSCAALYRPPCNVHCMCSHISPKRSVLRPWLIRSGLYACCPTCDWLSKRASTSLPYKGFVCTEQMLARRLRGRVPRGPGGAGGRESACPRGFASYPRLKAPVRPVLLRPPSDPKLRIVQRRAKGVSHHQDPSMKQGGASEGGLGRLLGQSPLFCGVRQKTGASSPTRGSCWSPWDSWCCLTPFTERSLAFAF